MKLVAVCACTAGIAHTYMAQEAIEQECRKRGIDCKVETQGGMGIDNELTEKEINEADAVVLAIAIGIKGEERFDKQKAAGKCIEVDPSKAIKNITGVIDDAEKLTTGKQSKGLKDLGNTLFKAFNTGISYFLPVIIVGGMLFSFTLMTGKIEHGQITPSNQFFKTLYDMGQAGFAMMVPVLCAYIAYAIAGKPALAPGFILGYVANNPIGADKLSTGFLGAMLLGVIIGYLVKWIKTWKVPQVIQAVMPTMIVPLIATLIVGIGYAYILIYPLDAFVKLMVSVLSSLNGFGAAALGIGIGVLAALDMGGPCSKAATAFTLALMAEGINGPNGAFRLCCAVPPLGLALSSLIISRQKYTEAEKQFGISALFLSSAGITEGAIPFAAKDFKRVIVSIVIGTAVAGVLGMLHGVESIVAFGGIVAIGGVTKGALWYVVDMLIGALVIAGILHVWKPDLDADGNPIIKT